MSKAHDLQTERDETAEVYIPEQDEADFLLGAYRDAQEMMNLKNQSQEILGNITLQEFWDRSNFDYNVLTEPKSINDPVTPYASSISRNQSNTFITNLTLQATYPSVVAQNENQEIDLIISKASRSLLEYAYDNDGRPAESGHSKSVRYTHKQVIEGTVHVQDDWEDDHLVSELAPNEEILVPNFFQPNIQMQPRVFRVKDNVTYSEAKAKFGDLENWKFVQAGQASQWLIDQDPLFKNMFDGIKAEERVQIIYIWYDIAKSDFKTFSIPKKRRAAKLFNVAINGVLMFDADNLMPYKHGNYPINKGIFEHFSKAEYYWGNSMPNKIVQDKSWLDGWKTLIRHKGKLGAIPPIITYNGSFLDQDIYIPGQSTQAPAGMSQGDIETIPGISNGPSTADFQLLENAFQEIQASSLSPQASGKSNPGQQTARESITLEVNEQKIIGGFGLQVAFFVESRTFSILKLAYQFLPRQAVKKISIPDQNLGEGRMGTLEILFSKSAPVGAEENLERSRQLLIDEERSDRVGKPKKTIIINPDYTDNMGFYMKAVADTKPKPTQALREARAERKFQIYASRPDLFNEKVAARGLARELGDDEMDIINTDQAQQQQQQQEEQQAGAAQQAAGGPEALRRSEGQQQAELQQS